jgi:hypothetical protein
MKFFLGTDSIVAINDGGIGIYFNDGEEDHAFTLGGVRPVLSLEVSFLSFLTANI